MSLSPQTASNLSLPSDWATGTMGDRMDGGANTATEIFEVRDLGLLSYTGALAIQHELVDLRKRELIPDTLLFVEHPHVVTVGRNAGRAAAEGHSRNLLASPEALRRAGIEFHESDRGGDVTYHGPGQIVGYPIVDLKGWKRDLGAYVRGIEQVLIGALAEFGIAGHTEAGATGVWVGQDEAAAAAEAKIAAIGIHVSRWVTSHGFALNLETDLDYFGHIVPCGLARPVTSMRKLGSTASRAAVTRALASAFGQVFSRQRKHTDSAIEWANGPASLPLAAANEFENGIF